MLVTGGEGTIGGVPATRGSTVLIPFAAGDTQTEGVEGIRCLPPDLGPAEASLVSPAPRTAHTACAAPV